MKKNLIFLLSFILIGLNSIAQDQDKKVLTDLVNENPNQASFNFEKDEFDFGKITQGESSTYEFKFTNEGTEPLVIGKAEGSCGCTVPIYPKEPIMKGQTAIIKVTFNSTGKSGVQDKTVTITSNAKQNPMVLHMKGIVEKPLEPASAPVSTPK